MQVQSLDQDPPVEGMATWHAGNTPVFSAGESHGQRSLVGEPDTTEAT